MAWSWATNDANFGRLRELLAALKQRIHSQSAEKLVAQGVAQLKKACAIDEVVELARRFLDCEHHVEAVEEWYQTLNNRHRAGLASPAATPRS